MSSEPDSQSPGAGNANWRARLPPELAEHADTFARNVLPDLARRESERLDLLRVANERGALAIAISVVAAGFSLIFFKSPAGLILGGMAGMWLWGSAQQNIQNFGREIKIELIREVSGAFGMTYAASPDGRMSEALKYFGLLPSWDRASFEDGLSGERHGMAFEFCEAHLEDQQTRSDGKNGTRTEWVTVFRGQCLAVRFPKAFTGVTKVLHDGGAGVLNRLFADKAQGERVKLEDPVFEKQFDVFSTDQIEARFILTPDFMERLLKLEEVFGGQRLRCAFAGGEMLLAVEGKNLFEPGSMKRPLDDPERLSEMLADFAALFALIDAMWARRPGGEAASSGPAPTV